MSEDEGRALALLAGAPEGLTEGDNTPRKHRDAVPRSLPENTIGRSLLIQAEKQVIVSRACYC